MIEIAGGIVLAVIALAGILAAIIWWPVTVGIAAFLAFVGWLHSIGAIR